MESEQDDITEIVISGDDESTIQEPQGSSTPRSEPDQCQKHWKPGGPESTPITSQEVGSKRVREEHASPRSGSAPRGERGRHPS